MTPTRPAEPQAQRARLLPLTLLLFITLTPRASAAILAKHFSLWPTLPHAGRVVESVEWMTADADLIISARVEDVERLPPTPGRVNWLKIRVEIDHIYRASHRVSPDLLSIIPIATWNRDLKPIDRSPLGRADDEAPAPPTPWHASRGLVLLFLDHRSRLGPGAEPVPGCDFVVRRHGGYLATQGPVEQAVRLNDRDGVANVAHEWLTESRAITNRVEQAARFANDPPRLELVDDDDGRPTQRLIVPANPLLEKEARFWALVGDNAIDPNFQNRWRDKRLWGARLLGHCPSPDSERVLRFLLGDTADARVHLGIGRATDHPLRRAARDALARHGIDASNAIIEEPTDWYHPITRATIGAALLILTVTVAVTCRTPSVRRPRPGAPPAPQGPRPRRLRAAATTLFMILTLLSATLHLRSLCGVDSVRQATATQLCEITSYRANVQFRLDPNYHGSTGLAAARFHPADFADRAAWDPQSLPTIPAWSHAGVSYATLPDASAGRPPITYLLIPHAWITTLLAAWPTLHLLSRARRNLRARHRKRNNLCPTCGYDCRASTTQCPECGAARPGRRDGK